LEIALKTASQMSSSFAIEQIGLIPERSIDIYPVKGK
jgi:hypothetical protein